jgi:hypothetical protein
MAIHSDGLLETPSTVKHTRVYGRYEKRGFQKVVPLLKKVSRVWEHGIQDENTFAYLA